MQGDAKVVHEFLHVGHLHQPPRSPSQGYDPRRAQQGGLLGRGHDGVQAETLEGGGEVIAVDLREVLPPELGDAGVLLPLEGAQDRHRLAVAALHFV